MVRYCMTLTSVWSSGEGPCWPWDAPPTAWAQLSSLAVADSTALTSSIVITSCFPTLKRQLQNKRPKKTTQQQPTHLSIQNLQTS